jgi:rare lipoprotein A
MNKFVSAAAIFITLTTSAAADPLSDFFDGAFGGQQPQQQQKVTRGKHGKGTISNDTTDTGSDWFGRASGGSHMVASFYGHGEKLSRHTASGAVFNPNAHTCAHRSYPFGTVLRVCHRGCVNVTVNDRGPFVRGRHLDLSYGAARAIGMGSTSSVTVERLN